MGTYYHIKDKESKDDPLNKGVYTVYEDDYIDALYSIAKKYGVEITEKMLTDELKRKETKKEGSKQRRCAIFIDGSNFYFKLKDLKLHNLLQFDFSAFAKMLAGKDKIVSVTYYIGKIRADGTEKTQKLFNNQRKLLAHLRKHKLRYSLGYLMKSDDKYHEKGVDVNIAVDMLVATYENLCDRIILISSDTDLLPAIEKAKEKGMQVEYIGFSHKPSVAMVAVCSMPRLLMAEELSKFIGEK
ncbi:NYN domain-containing protein [Patescibacteria group bacterium]|nr:NYN domain-containing protein [Patescibacteria group bacterium]